MARNRSFEDLIIWQEARRLVPQVYRTTLGFPPDEKFGLIAQARRAAVSVPSNIAEGWARNTRGDFNHFLGIALGSIAELQTQMYLGEDLTFLTGAESTHIRNESSRLRGLILRFKSSMP